VPKVGFGEPGPKFVAPTPHNPKFHFDTIAGRPILMVFLGHPLTRASAQLVQEVKANRAAFDDKFASVFYIVSDPLDIELLEIKSETPGIRYFMDYDRTIAKLYGYAQPAPDGTDEAQAPVECGVTLLDMALRGLQSAAAQTGKPMIEPLLDGLRRLESFFYSFKSLNHAPVMVLERVFEPAFCRRLIEYYNANEPKDSGFMREKDGYTVGIIDHGFKRRQDVWIEDNDLMRAGMNRVHRRLVPEIKKAYQFEVTRIERHIVACYDAGRGGFFRAHRDNTTKGTAHRRFAVTINLNAEEFEGGELRLPEFGEKSYRAPTGGAVVFSCSLLHEALPVTKGTRYAYLPFLYNDDDAKVRQENRKYLDSKSGGMVDVDAALAAKKKEEEEAAGQKQAAE
jgi:hypothetical protein